MLVVVGEEYMLTDQLEVPAVQADPEEVVQQEQTIIYRVLRVQQI
jgi:hypothetical protein